MDLDEARRVLRISPNADNHQIKAAYRRMARQKHPDVNKSPNAPKQFQRVVLAYEVLMNGPQAELFFEPDTIDFGYITLLPSDHSAVVNLIYLTRAEVSPSAVEIDDSELYLCIPEEIEPARVDALGSIRFSPVDPSTLKEGVHENVLIAKIGDLTARLKIKGLVPAAIYSVPPPKPPAPTPPPRSRPSSTPPTSSPPPRTVHSPPPPSAPTPPRTAPGATVPPRAAPSSVAAPYGGRFGGAPTTPTATARSTCTCARCTGRRTSRAADAAVGGLGIIGSLIGGYLALVAGAWALYGVFWILIKIL